MLDLFFCCYMNFINPLSARNLDFPGRDNLSLTVKGLIGSLVFFTIEYFFLKTQNRKEQNMNLRNRSE